jgi:amidohydrolase
MTTIDELLQRWLDGVDRRLGAAIELRHELHQHPDLSGHEQPTADRIMARLSPACSGSAVAGTGRLVRIGPATGRSIAIRGELDALPIEETTGLSHAATNGAMHACGHDLHLAAVTLVAEVARDLPLPFGLLVTLQPREETYPSGAKDIVDSGMLEEHDAAIMLGLHVQSSLPGRVLSTGAGPVNAAADEFTIVVRGKGGHAAYPHLTRDPIVAAAQVILALQQVVARRTDPTHPAVLSIGSLSSGSAPNVIPDTVTLGGSLRTLNPEDREPMRDALRSVTTHAAAAAGCEAHVELEVGEPVLVNDAALVAAVDQVLEKVGVNLVDPLRSCGADDFSYFSECMPSLMMFLGTEGPSSLHRSDFYPPDDLVRDAARALVAAYCGAARLLQDGADLESHGLDTSNVVPVPSGASE